MPRDAPHVVKLADALVIVLALFTGFAHAEGSFAGRTRFDLDRAEIREFVEATAAAQKVQPLDVYRLLAKAEPQPKILEAISKPAEKVSPWWRVPRALPHRGAHLRGRAVHGTNIAQRLEQARRETGVAPEYIVAIVGVETFYGRTTGKLSRARRARDARLRLSTARRILPLPNSRSSSSSRARKASIR